MFGLSARGIVLLVTGIIVSTPLARAGEPGRSEREDTKGKNYAGIALRPPPINTSPGLEYASSTMVYQGIPGIERSADGRLWALWNAAGTGDSFGEGPFDYVLLVTSGDDGKTWSQPKLVIDPPGNVHAWNGCLWVDPQARLWLFWSQDYGEWDGRGGAWAIVCANPDSEKPKWSKPRRIANGNVLNKPTVLMTAEWLLPVAVWSWECTLREANERFRLGLSPSAIKALCHDLGEEKGLNIHVSSDQGETWKLLGQARGAAKDQLCEHMIVERRDGSLWMLARTGYGIGQSISTDRGRTWGLIDESGIRHPRTRFFIRRLKSGSLLMIRHNPPSVEYPKNCDNCGYMNRSHLTAYLSDDDGGLSAILS